MNENTRLKEVRKVLGFTQKQFSEKIGIKQGSYSDIERGKVGISANLMRSLVSKYRINPTWLYDGHGNHFLDEEVISRPSNLKSFGKHDEAVHTHVACENCQHYEEVISAHLETIQIQKDYIISLKDMIEELKSDRR